MNQSYLEYIICLLQPDRIVHLASISNTEECEKNPIRTIDTNGRLVANLCDIIYRNKLHCTLFHASSSELYKGHQEYVIHDHDESFFPTTMYGISKAMGHRTVDHYRATYGLPFSNGILFMTESKLRSSQFLLKKVALHAKEYKQHKKPIHLGGLDSWRNMNHASDVARAIHMILNEIHGNNYVICSSNFYKVEDVIIDIYKQVDIILEKKDNHFVDVDTNEIVICIGSSLRNTITKINGNPERLTQLGWKPTYTLQMIINELLE